MMTEKEKMLSGKIHDPSDIELMKLRTNAHRLSKAYNDCLEKDEKRAGILGSFVNITGDNVYFRKRNPLE